MSTSRQGDTEEFRDSSLSISEQDIDDSLAQEIDYDYFSGEMDYEDYL